MINKILNWKLTAANFTFFAIFACVLGVNFSIGIGGIQLSLYRLILVLIPFFLLLPAYNKLIRNKSSNGYFFIKFLFVWLVYSVVTGLWVEDYLSWFKSLVFLASGLLFSVLIFANVNTKHKFIRASRIVVFVSMALSVLAFYESITGNYFFLSASSLEWYQNVSLLHKASFFREPITVFGNPNNYALFLYFSFGFSVLLLFLDKNKLLKFLYSIFLLVTVFLIIITLSRSAFLGLCLFLTSMTAIILLKGSKALTIRFVFLLLIFGTIIGQVLFKYFYLVEELLLLEFGSEGSSDSVRKNLILNGFVFLYKTLFLGTGLGNIEYYMAYQKVYNVGEIVNLHNWWMEILTSSGVLIFIFYMWVYGRSLLRLWRGILMDASRDTFWMNSIFISLLLGFVVSAVGPSSLIGCEWFWPLMALSFKSSYITD